MGQRSVLSVEDSDTDFMALQFALKSAGVTAPLERLSTGRAALTWMHDAPACRLEERTSLVLLDLNLPGIDGLQLLKAARQRDPDRHVPIIVLTTSSHPRDVAKSYEAGADAYMVKPLALEDWGAKVGPLTEFWLKAVAGRSMSPSVADAGVSTADRRDRLLGLTRTIEREVIPRLLLAHERDARAELPRNARALTTSEDAVAELARLALEADVPDLVTFVESHRVGTGIDTVFQQLIAPASRLIGDLWKTDHCDFKEFSLALARLQHLLVELNPGSGQPTRH